MRILAVDPGYERLGIAVLEKLSGQKEKLLYSACIQTPKILPHAERLLKISEEVRKVIGEYEPSACAIETLFLAVNQKTAMPVAEARVAVLVEAARAGLTVHEYTPLQIKIAVTGYGKSDKKQVMEMVKKLIALPPAKRLDDEYDAIAVGLTCLACERTGTRNWNRAICFLVFGFQLFSYELQVTVSDSFIIHRECLLQKFSGVDTFGGVTN